MIFNTPIDIARNDDSELRVTGIDTEEFTKESLLWEDEETRYFYEELPDLKAFLPSILYKDSAQATIQQVMTIFMLKMGLMVH